MEEFSERKETEKVVDFLKKNDNFSIFYHLDDDGITSAVILSKALEKMGKSVYAFRVTNYEDFEKGIDLTYFSDNVILCDVQPTKRFTDRFDSMRLCIIDHHELIEPGNFVYINPKMWGDFTYTPCSLVVYRLFERLVQELDWVAAIGVISDSGGKANSDFIKKTAERNGVALKNDEYLFDNDFGLASTMVGSMTVQYGRSGAEEAVGIIKSTSSIKELLENQRLISANISAKRELQAIKENFEQKKELYGGFVYFFEANPVKKRYSSSVITPLSLEREYYGKIIVFMTKINSRIMRINMRANGVKIKLPEVMREVFKTINGSGGGHDMAAAAVISPMDSEKFKRIFLEEAKKNISVN